MGPDVITSIMHGICQKTTDIFLYINNLFVTDSNSDISVTEGSPASTERRLLHCRFGSRVMTWWRHTGPLSSTFHIIAAFALLLPSALLDARKIEHNFRPQGKMKY